MSEAFKLPPKGLPTAPVPRAPGRVVKFNTASTEGFEPAKFWKRIIALVIDGLIIAGSQKLITTGLSFFLKDKVMQFAFATMIGMIGPVLYYCYLTLQYKGATPGKKLLGIRVVSTQGKHLNFMQVLKRETLGRFVCGITLGIGYLVALSGNKRGWHDRIGKTQVVEHR